MRADLLRSLWGVLAFNGMTVESTAAYKAAARLSSAFGSCSHQGHPVELFGNVKLMALFFRCSPQLPTKLQPGYQAPSAHVLIRGIQWQSTAAYKAAARLSSAFGSCSHQGHPVAGSQIRVSVMIQTHVNR
ncbi:hypothetical protein MUK42_18200 [Musa troglodytarum]|uniref:Uncharacterized protein n=1 Tax=Musa troglodytarum TaxID=320322 RepID=A0A9E7HUZ0_9LILI|nr:hypothetical protein MUK42_18200 [Musa troglodytarum]